MYPAASRMHSTRFGRLVGLVRCVEMVKNMMIAIICTGSEQNKTIRYARVNSWTANYVPYLGGVLPRPVIPPVSEENEHTTCDGQPRLIAGGTGWNDTI